MMRIKTTVEVQVIERDTPLLTKHFGITVDLTDSALEAMDLRPSPVGYPLRDLIAFGPQQVVHSLLPPATENVNSPTEDVLNEIAKVAGALR